MIQDVLDQPTHAQQVAQNGYECVQSLTYLHRAQIFLEFYERRLSELGRPIRSTS